MNLRHTPPPQSAHHKVKLWPRTLPHSHTGLMEMNPKHPTAENALTINPEVATNQTQFKKRTAQEIKDQQTTTQRQGITEVLKNLN